MAAVTPERRPPRLRTLRLIVPVAGPSPFAYQWHKNGVALPGATAAVYTVAAASAADAGAYTLTATNACGTVNSPATVVGVVAPVPGRLANFSVRTTAGTAERTLIGAFGLTTNSRDAVLVELYELP